jgi:pyruvate dehydrogenase E2 component (dihydrolipoamide acetyltransferase)
MEVEAMDTGVLLKILAYEGEDIPVVQTIGYIGEPGDEIPQDTADQTPVKAEEEKRSAAKPVTDQANTDSRVKATPAAKRLAGIKGIDLNAVQPSGNRGQIKAADIKASGEKTKATGVAKAMGKEFDLSLDEITGSGYAGKVTKADVLQAVDVKQLGETELKPHSMMRKVIAKRMLQSHTDIPPVTQSCVADVTDLLALRSRINAGGLHVSVNDFIIMAVAKALKEHPEINASYSEDGLLIKRYVNIGMAVALPDGLIVPVIRNADKMKLTEISDKSKELAKKAREGRLNLDDYSGATFTISNLGMLGVTSFTPIINQPEIAILGVCTIEQKLEMDDNGAIVKKSKMQLSLTYDHRCIDGAQAAHFSNRVVKMLENPLIMLA